MTSRTWSALLLLALGGCRAFPEIATGECGNRVVEPGEDCDFFGQDTHECRAAGSVGACHFDCSADSDGKRRACPPDFGCDESSVCRRAANTFDVVQNPVPGGYQALETADFDGDGRADVIGFDARGGSVGLAHVDFHYYDERGQPSASFGISEPVTGAALFTQQTAGGREGLVVAAHENLAVMLGERNRTLSPDVRPSYFLQNRPMTIVPVSDRNVGRTSPLIVLAEQDGIVTFYIPGTEDVLLVKLLELPHSLKELAPPARGALFQGDEHPCDELVLAAFGARQVSSYQVCQADPSTPQLAYRSEALVTTRELPGGAVVDHDPLIVDLDGDEHLDLLVSSDQGLLAAYGDGEALTELEPFELSLFDIIESVTERVDQAKDPIKPVAAADFTGDGRADLVAPGMLLVSTSVRGEAGNVFRKVHENVGAPWSEAKIADVTGDGKPDVVAASRSQTDIDVFMGTGTERPNSIAIKTTHPAERLTTADYDGDQIDDIAFVERGAGPSLEDEFLVAFGGTIETLSTPAQAGHVGGIWDLVALPDSANNLRFDLGIIHDLTDEEGSEGSAMSIVQGSVRRDFVSTVQLEDVGGNGELHGAAALLATTGRFRDAAAVDALALAYHGEPPDKPMRFYPELWLFPNLGSRTSTMKLLGWDFEPVLVPASFDPKDPEAGTRASLRAGDLTGDGLDEIVVVAPSERDERCLVALASLIGPTFRLQASPPLVLDEPCVATPSLKLADLDGDGATDLVLATGNADTQGRIVAFWNDGSGGFTSSAATTLVPREAGARTFTLYRNPAGGVPRVAYVSEHAAHVLESRGRDRAFAEIGAVTNLTSATGIAAGDINGDGLVDLAVADNGSIQLLRAAVVR